MLIIFLFVGGLALTGCSNGEDGADGTDGATWLYGDTIPSETAGSDGDFYIDFSTYNIYVKANGAWLVSGNIQGTAGEDGTTPIVTINSDGYWVINGVVTDICALGEGQYSKVLVSSPYSTAEVFEGKKITFFGDSITAGACATSTDYRWTTLLASMLGATEYNMGVGGTTLVERYDSTTYTDLADIPEDSDYIIVALGTNDYGGNDITLGVLGDSGLDTVYGLIDLYCQYLTTNYPNATIYFSTPITRGTGSYVKNWSGYTLRQMCQAIIDVTAKYGIATMDMNVLSGIYYTDEDDENVSTYLYDGIHPNDDGYELMATAMKEFLLENWQYVSAKDVCTVTFDGSSVLVVDGTKYTIPTPTAVDGKIFKFWVCSNGETYSAGSVIKIESDLTFTSLFVPDDSCYKITVEANGGSTNYSTILVEKGLSLDDTGVTLTAEHTSYGLVASWYTDASFTTEFDTSEVLTEDITIYAYWEMDSSLFVYGDIAYDSDDTPYATIIGYATSVVSNASSVTNLIFPKYDPSGNIITTISGNSTVSSSSGKSVSMTFGNLESLVIPEGYTTIEKFMYYSTNSATTATVINSAIFTVSLPSTIASVDLYSFVGAQVSAYSVADGDSTYYTLGGALCFTATNGKPTMIKYNHGNKETDIVIPTSIERLYNNLFALNPYVETITFGSNCLINNYLYSSLITGTSSTLKTLIFTATATSNIPEGLYQLFASFSTSSPIFSTNGQIIVANTDMQTHVISCLDAVSGASYSDDLTAAIQALEERVVVAS